MEKKKSDGLVANQALATSVGNDIFEYLGRTFPVACANDEFIYFPQVKLAEPEWSNWDHFSTEVIKETVQRLSSWEDKLDLISSEELDLALHVDVALLKKIVRSLQEQLSEVRSWEYQPTFYLTIACTGLAEAIGSEDPAAIHDRAKSLPRFLDQAIRNLNNVPVLFRDIGLEMVADTRNYFITFLKSLSEIDSALVALDHFRDALHRVATRQDFLLPKDLLERVICFHLNCDMDIEHIGYALDQEIVETKRTLVKETKMLYSGQSSILDSERIWLEALRNIPVSNIGKRELIQLYEKEISRLANYCIEQSLVSSRLVFSCPVIVLSMPAFLSAIRVGASYSIPPRHPPTGGTFYIPAKYSTEESKQASIREYRMTCAHETYPGHHLLDSSRWSLERPLRRNIEYPIFYEGWACFAEELMRLTGYFSEPVDRLLLARRRLSHAIRGKVDIGLQTGTMDFATATNYLEETGISKERAALLARKYPLSPGYQACYTIGLHRFWDLWHQYGTQDLPKFVRTVLSQGEILFSDLEKILEDYA